MEAKVSNDRIVRVDSSEGNKFWFSITGSSITAGGLFTKNDLLLMHGMIGSVIK